MKQFCKPIESNAPQSRSRGQKMRTLFLMLVLGCGSVGSAFAQDVASVAPQTFGLGASELQSILQKCVDLPGMQKYYPVDAAKHLQPVNIMQLPIAFPAEVSASKGGQPVNFINVSKANFSRQAAPAAYAMFRTIEHSGDAVQVHFNYFYKTGAEQTLQPLFVVVDFKKSGTQWTVVTSSVKE